MHIMTHENHEGGDDVMDVDKGKQKEGDEAASRFTHGQLTLAVNAERRYWRKPARRK